MKETLEKNVNATKRYLCTNPHQYDDEHFHFVGDREDVTAFLEAYVIRNKPEGEQIK